MSVKLVPRVKTSASTAWRDTHRIAFRPEHAEETYEALAGSASVFRASDDRRAIFPDMYGVITRNVRDALLGLRAPDFHEKAWLSRLTGFFAERYFDALSLRMDGQPAVSGAWHVAFDRAADRSVYPLQDALLGINAHINYDLAQGLRDNIVLHGTFRDERAMRGYRHDHDAVNEILYASMPEIFRLLAERYDCPVSQGIVANPAVQARASQAFLHVLALWRNRVWDELLMLLHNPQPERRRRILAATNQRSTLMARAIAGPRFLLVRGNAAAPRQALAMVISMLADLDRLIVSSVPRLAGA